MFKPGQARRRNEEKKETIERRTKEKTINWKGKRNRPIKRKAPPPPRIDRFKSGLSSGEEIPLRAGPRPQYLTEFIRHCWMAAVVKMITDDPWASLALTGNEVRSALAGCPRMPGRLLDRVPLGRSYPPRIYTHPFPSTLDNFRCNDPSYRVILRLGRIWNGFENLLDSFFLESCPIFWNFFQLGIRCLRNLQVLRDFACFKQNKIKIRK